MLVLLFKKKKRVFLLPRQFPCGCASRASTKQTLFETGSQKVNSSKGIKPSVELFLVQLFKTWLKGMHELESCNMTVQNDSDIKRYLALHLKLRYSDKNSNITQLKISEVGHILLLNIWKHFCFVILGYISHFLRAQTRKSKPLSHKE